MPYAVATELTPAGADLLVVVDEVGRWLTEAPGNPVAVDNETAGSYIKSLAEGWASIRAYTYITAVDSSSLELSVPALVSGLTEIGRRRDPVLLVRCCGIRPGDPAGRQSGRSGRPAGEALGIGHGDGG